MFGDENEHFMPHYSPLYNYPYQKRSSFIADLKLEIELFNAHREDYLFPQYNLDLGLSQTCLEQSLFSQIIRPDYIIESYFESEEEEGEEKEEAKENEEESKTEEEPKSEKLKQLLESNKLLEFECEKQFIQFQKLKLNEIKT